MRNHNLQELLNSTKMSNALRRMNKRNGNQRAGRAAKGRGGALTTSQRNANIITSVIVPWMPLFPATITKRLRYSTNFLLATTAGAVATYVFRANDLFDPDFTGTGHQPMGFDQLMVFYNHFCVTRAKLIVTFKCYSSVDQTVCIRQDATNAPLTVIDRIIEFGGLTMAQVGSSGEFGGQVTLDLTLDIAKLQGVTRTALTADPTLRGDAATSPTEVTYFHVAAWDAVGNGANIQCSVILEQEAHFMEPRDATESFKKRRDEEMKSPKSCDPDLFSFVPVSVKCGCKVNPVRETRAS